MIFLLVKYIRKAQIGQLKALIKAIECYTKYLFFILHRSDCSHQK